MSGFNDLLGIDIIGDTEEGFTLTMEIDPDKHHHSAGMVHGGVYLALLDTVIARTVRTKLEDVDYAPTQNITVNFFRPSKSGTIKAVGNIINKSSNMCCAEGRLYGDNGKLLAQGVGNQFIVKPAK